ncbi:MAG: hypothetical protein HeimC3_01340 [Candidatus Heimdallarchaeota archaeon LC_3]|nr:MAG: hypothetical protein HeimC3_01340 [Candidatus Heimdallarchaeota archaeon LC_3]
MVSTVTNIEKNAQIKSSFNATRDYISNFPFFNDISANSLCCDLMDDITLLKFSFLLK